MIPVIAYWYDDLEQLHRKLPLSTVGRHAAHFGFADVPFHLLCLRGPEISCSLKAEWEGYGFVLHDGRDLYASRVKQFAALKSQYSPHFFDCFLRWLVLSDYFKGESILSLDADIFLNIKLSELLKQLRGSTGTASSTCFVPVSTPVWFEVYEQELLRLQADKNAYLEQMRVDMGSLLVGDLTQPGHETIFGLKACKSLKQEELWRNHFDWTPEELLVDYLIRKKRLPQDPWQVKFPYLVCPQFFVLPDLAWVTPLPENVVPRLQTPLALSCRNGTYALNDKVLGFVHLQGAQSRLYASKLILQHFFAGVTRMNRIKSDLHPGDLAAPTTLQLLEAYRRVLEKNPCDHRVKHFCHNFGDPFNESQLSRKLMLDFSLKEIFNPEVSDFSGLWK